MQVLKESKIQHDVVQYAKSWNFIAIKLTSFGSRGWPDYLFITPDGRVFFIEFKRPDTRPSGLQSLRIELLRMYGCSVFVCSDISKGKEIIDEMAATRLSNEGHIADAGTGGSRTVFGSGFGENLGDLGGIQDTEGQGPSEEDAGGSATEADGAYVAQ